MLDRYQRVRARRCNNAALIVDWQRETPMRSHCWMTKQFMEMRKYHKERRMLENLVKLYELSSSFTTSHLLDMNSICKPRKCVRKITKRTEIGKRRRDAYETPKDGPKRQEWIREKGSHAIYLLKIQELRASTVTAHQNAEGFHSFTIGCCPIAKECTL